MTPDQLSAVFPKLCEFLAGTIFDSDVAALLSIAEQGEDDLRDSLEGRLFNLNELMWLIGGAVIPALEDQAGRELETNLVAVILEVGIEKARTVYLDKFLVDRPDKFEDLRYEIAATARACTILDPRSIELEKKIPDDKKPPKDWKNSDIFGMYQGNPVRIEVTVLHETLPPSVSLELDEIVRTAETISGFDVNLRYVLADQGHAERVRSLVELLYETHSVSQGINLEIDEVRFEWRRGAYHCPQQSSPIESIIFHEPGDFEGADRHRDVIHPCSTRNLTPAYIFEDHPNPPGVVTMADLPGTPKNVPTSTKISQMLAGKLQQCETGMINVIAFGIPQPMNDRDLEDAVAGVTMAGYSLTTDHEGVRHTDGGRLYRDPKAPFVPSEYLASDDDLREFVEPFRKMSAVWGFRIGWHPRGRVYSNPNASVPAPGDLFRALSDSPTLSPTDTAGSLRVKVISIVPSGAHSQGSEASDEIVFPEMAEGYLAICGNMATAKEILESLEISGVSLDEIRSKLNQVWEVDAESSKRMKFVSLTNEEAGMQLVLDCGGFVQARACLEALDEE